MEEKLFCKGYTWGFFGESGAMQTDAAAHSMRRLAENGLDWICIPVTAWQETFASTTVFSLYGMTQSDADITHAVQLAQSLGLMLMLANRRGIELEHIGALIKQQARAGLARDDAYSDDHKAVLAFLGR